jgi:hypothetical protein
MKKQIILLALTAAATLFFSCKKTEGAVVSQARGSEESKPVAVESNITKQGYALRVNTGLYVIDGEDNGGASTKTKWAAGMILGESVITGKIRRMTFNNKEYDFIEVRRDDKKEGYALDYQIAVGGRLAVVVEEKANLFSAPKTVNVTNTIISRKTVLVYIPESESGGFVEIKGIDNENSYWIPESRYMRLSSLSRNESDIQASILLQTAQTMTGANQTIAKEALLKSALQDYPNSVFYNEIRAIVNPNEYVSYDDDY